MKRTSRSQKSAKRDEEDIEAIADRAHAGEDVSEHFSRKYEAKQRVNVDFPLNLLRQIDAECKRIGVSRQAWIKMVCDEQLRSTTAPRRESPGEIACSSSDPMTDTIP
jgi:hypothetical protein